MKNPTKTDLFPSFSFLLGRSSHEDFAPSDEALRTGLFTFSCTREAVFEDTISRKYIDDVVGGEQAEKMWSVLRNRLRPAILQAENEGRVIWRTQDETMGFERINAFLKKHDLDVVDEKRYHEVVLYDDRFNDYKAKQIYDLDKITLWS